MAGHQFQITSPESLPELFRHSRYAALLGVPGTVSVTGTRKDVRARLREHCSDQSGVYGMVSATGQLIYVGMSRCLKKRLQSYFSSKISRTKERRIGHRSTTLIWQPTAHELIARLRERELIRLYRPNHNVQGHPTRMKLGYLTLVNQAAPAFVLSPHLPKTHGGIWGPLPLTRFLKTAVGELNHHFQLRDCPRKTPISFKHEPAHETADFTPCMRADLRTCLAPCVRGCTLTAYTRAVTAAKRFLNGDAGKTLAAIEQQMRDAVVVRKFEKAAQLRDRRQVLERIHQHLRRFHDWTSHANFVYPIVSSMDEQEWWLIVVRGTVQEVWSRPCTSEEKTVATERFRLIGEQLSGSSTQSVVTGPDEFESSRLLFRWFRHFPKEKDRQLTLAKARRLCHSILRKQS